MITVLIRRPYEPCQSFLWFLEAGLSTAAVEEKYNRLMEAQYPWEAGFRITMAITAIPGLFERVAKEIEDSGELT